MFLLLVSGLPVGPKSIASGPVIGAVGNDVGHAKHPVTLPVGGKLEVNVARQDSTPVVVVYAVTSQPDTTDELVVIQLDESEFIEEHDTQ